jgi:4-azaleucine resistance transporter AzlC
MGTFWRTHGADRKLVRDVAAIAAASAVIGVSFGAIASAAGVPAWAIVTMSLAVFAGGAQFMAVGMIAVGSPVAAIAGGLLLNARHLPFGLSIADVFRGEGRLRRLAGVHLMVDESVAFSLAQADPRRREAAYWLTGASLFVAWNTGTVLGILLGAAVGDPMRYGLDAAFPAALIALLLPRLREPIGLRVGLLGAAVAVAATFVLPPGLPVLLALVALVAAWRAPVRARRSAS